MSKYKRILNNAISKFERNNRNSEEKYKKITYPATGSDVLKGTGKMIGNIMKGNYPTYGLTAQSGKYQMKTAEGAVQAGSPKVKEREILRKYTGKGGPTSVATPPNPPIKKELGVISTPGSSSLKPVLPSPTLPKFPTTNPINRDPSNPNLLGFKSPTPGVPTPGIKVPNPTPVPLDQTKLGQISQKPVTPKQALPVKPVDPRLNQSKPIGQNPQIPVNQKEKYKQFPRRGNGWGRNHKRQQIMHDRIAQKKKIADAQKKQPQNNTPEYNKIIGDIGKLKSQPKDPTLTYPM